MSEMSNEALEEMACQELVEVITNYLEGTLPDRDRRRFEAHLLTCSPCREYVEQMRTTIRLAGRVSVESISPRLRDELLHAFRRMKDSSTDL
jgi:anti-sigma factor RsiW